MNTPRAVKEKAMVTDYLLGQPLSLAPGTYLLANSEFIEDQWNIDWHVGRPELLDEPLVMPLSTWENIQGMAKILRDRETGRFRMWYLSCNRISYRHFFMNESAPGPLPGAYCVGYAESDDGLHWRKPELDVWTIPDGQRTNIVFWGHHGGQIGEVFENVPGGKARFAMAYLDVANGVEGICLAWSDDGFHWERDPANPMLPCMSDCQNNIIYNPLLKRYVLITRPYPHASGIYEWDPPGHRHMRRRIAVSTSSDLRTWTPIRVALYPEPGDLPDFDNMTAMAYGSQFIGFLHVFNADTEQAQRMTSYLALSADGLHWQRIRHEPFLTQGFSGQAFDESSVGVSGTWLPLDEQRIVLYYIGRAHAPDQSSWGQVRLVGMSLRRDGFIYGTPGRSGPTIVRNNTTGDHHVVPTGDSCAYLLTREFILPAGDLYMNADAVRGAVRVEVVNRETTKSYPGFEREQCIPLIADRVDMPVRWQHAELASLVGKPVMLRIVLDPEAQVYAIRLGQE